MKKLIQWYKEALERDEARRRARGVGMRDEEMTYEQRKQVSYIGCFSCLLILVPILVILLIIVLTQSCAGPSKIQTVQEQELRASIGLVEVPIKEIAGQAGNDEKELTFKDDQGKTMTLMKAEADENGEMVARDRIVASVVTARFRNVAERGGKVNIIFEIRVPKEMQDELWQLRFYPTLQTPGQAGGDVRKLEPIYVTGAKYRESQLKGYERYNRFLDSIIRDSTRFIDLKKLEVFIQRNIPDLYAFKKDSTIVSEAKFASAYGVTEQDAIDHYTRKISKRRNARRAARSEAMYRRYVPVPIVQEGIRLDTVVLGDKDLLYTYVETIPARQGMKKASVKVAGEIYELDKVIYKIPASDSLTYYISSLTAFVDKSQNPHDAKYQDGIKALLNRDYKRAITLLKDYKDINTALAYLELEYNGTARVILEDLDARSGPGMTNADIKYLLAVVYARTDREEQAKSAFLKACELKPAFWHRGNLDPEIAEIVKRFNLSNN
ncbi:MAG: hypothetical protein IK119_04145 [Bacteroidales bacterium]|nr:hypothetical protein [Bacteroidales bacterium]